MEPLKECFRSKFDPWFFYLLYIAMALVPLERERVGLRMARGEFVYVPVLLLAVFGYVLQDHWLQGWAVLLWIVCLRQHACRWNDLKRGVLLHTRNFGVPLFHRLGVGRIWPKVAHWFETDNRAERFFDPFVSLFAGLLLLPLDKGLGEAVLVSAFAMRAFEEFRWERGLDALLDKYDGIIAAQGESDWLQEARSGQPAGTAPTAASSVMPGAAATGGMGSDLRDVLLHRLADAEAKAAKSRHPAVEIAGAVKEAAEAVTEAAEAINAAKSPSGPGMVIIASEQRQDTLVMVKETIIREPVPELANSETPVSLMLTGDECHAEALDAPVTPPQLPAPVPTDDEQS